MRIVYFGGGIRGIRCLEHLIENNRIPLGIISTPRDMQQFNRIERTFNIELLVHDKVNNPNFVERIASLKPDLMILAGYNQILRRPLLDIPPMGTINLHGGKLPEYRGVAPINWQIINGETTGGCCILFTDEGIDTGDIICQKYYKITETDTAATVLKKTLDIFPKMLIECLNKIEEGELQAEPQNLTAGCYYTRRYPRDGKIDWYHLTEKQVYNLVRALVTPYPGAFTFFQGRKIYIWEVALYRETIKGVPGRIVLKNPEGVLATTRDRAILIKRVQREGAEEMPARDFFRNVPIGTDFD